MQDAGPVWRGGRRPWGRARRPGAAGLDRRDRGLLPGRRRPAPRPVLLRHHRDQLPLPRLPRPRAQGRPVLALVPRPLLRPAAVQREPGGLPAPAEVPALPLAADLAGVEPRHGAVGLAGGPGGLRLAPPPRRAGRRADRRGGLRPGGLHLGPPGPHQLDQRPGGGAAGASGPWSRRGRGGSGAAWCWGRRRWPVQVFAGQLQSALLTGLAALAVRRLSRGDGATAWRVGRVPWGRPSGSSPWGWRCRPCSGSPPGSCSPAPRAPGASPGPSRPTARGIPSSCPPCSSARPTAPAPATPTGWTDSIPIMRWMFTWAPSACRWP